jgi:predicted DNA-binding WGR domain protein
MKRTFVCVNEKSRKYWSIEPVKNEMLVTYGKLAEKSEFDAFKQESNKTFETEELCAKEVEKLIKQKVKGGYLEQDQAAIDFWDGARYDQFAIAKKEEKLKRVIESLDTRGEPLKLHYELEEMLENIAYRFIHRERVGACFPQNSKGKPLPLFNNEYKDTQYKVDFSNLKEIIKRIDKIECEDFFKNTLYCYGIRMAGITADKDFEDFCKKHVSVEGFEGEYAAGLAYCLAANNASEEEILEQIDIATKKGLSRKTIRLDPIIIQKLGRLDELENKE